MADVATYSIDGLDLARWRIRAGSSYRAPVAIEHNAVSIPGADGVILAGRGTASAPLLTLILAPARDVVDTAALELLNDDLAALVARPATVVTRTVGTTSRSQAAALVSSDWSPEIVWGRYTRVTLTFRLPGVYWRDTTDTTTALAVGSTALDVGSAPVSDAIVRFALDAANPILTDAQTGTGISVAHDAVATDYIYVDCGQLQAWKSASSSQWTRPSSSADWLDALVSYPGPGPLRMTPAVTESGGVLSRLATLTSSHTASVQFKKAWW